MDRLYFMNINCILRNMVLCIWKYICKLMYVFDFFKIYMYMIYKNEFIKNLIDILKFYFFFERNFFIIEFGYDL